MMQADISAFLSLDPAYRNRNNDLACFNVKQTNRVPVSNGMIGKAVRKGAIPLTAALLLAASGIPQDYYHKYVSPRENAAQTVPNTARGAMMKALRDGVLWDNEGFSKLIVPFGTVAGAVGLGLRNILRGNRKAEEEDKKKKNKEKSTDIVPADGAAGTGVLKNQSSYRVRNAKKAPMLARLLLSALTTVGGPYVGMKAIQHLPGIIKAPSVYSQALTEERDMDPAKHFGAIGGATLAAHDWADRVRHWLWGDEDRQRKPKFSFPEKASVNVTEDGWTPNSGK